MSGDPLGSTPGTPAARRRPGQASAKAAYGGAPATAAPGAVPPRTTSPRPSRTAPGPDRSRRPDRHGPIVRELGGRVIEEIDEP